MRFSRKICIILAVIAPLLLAGCGLSLAEDITPPPNYRPPQPVEETRAPDQPASVSTVFPLVPPDPAEGAQIYAEKCLPCHGEEGNGDGPQAANLPNPAAPIGSKDLARQSRPADWFRIVSVGNLERFMPGFSGSLDERQRWDVVAYTYTLSTSPQELEQGEAIYTENCAGCHGEGGQGDGPEAASLATPPARWADQERLAELSAEDMVNVITGGKEGHPSFADEIDEAGRYAAAAYVRQLSFETAGQPGDAPGEQAAGNAGETQSDDPQADAVLPDVITISGKVTNATPGGAIPAGMQVKVQAFDGMSPAFEVMGDVADDGSYTIEEVDFDPNYVYFAQVDVNGLSFNSEILHGRDVSGEQAEMPIEIYETTTDASALRADRLHVFFDFSQPGKVQVVNLYIISNPGDQVVIAPSEEQPVISFPLPEGAENLQFEDGQIGGRYVETPEGFGDRMGVSPGVGQHQVLFAYDLPYDRKLALEVYPPLPVDAAIVMVPPVGVRLQSDQLSDAGPQNVQGMSFQMYQLTNGLNAGDTLGLTLTGRAGAAGATDENSLNYLLIGLGVFGLVLAGAGYWFFRQRAQLATEEGEIETDAEVEAVANSEAILDEILALDDLHASGKLPEAAYQERRAHLKAQLAEAIHREKNTRG